MERAVVRATGMDFVVRAQTREGRDDREGTMPEQQPKGVPQIPTPTVPRRPPWNQSGPRSQAALRLARPMRTTRVLSSGEPHHRRLLEPAAFSDDQPADRKAAFVGVDQAETRRVARDVKSTRDRDRLAGLQQDVK